MTDAASSDRIAGLIAQRRSRPKNAPTRVTGDDPAPLSTVQLSLWTLGAINTRSGSTNRPTATRLLGPLDIAALGRVLERLVERHEPLRTIYPFAGEEPVQELVARPTVVLAIEDISELSAQAGAAALHDAMRAAASHDFDVATQIQFQATLLVESAESHVLVVALSHMAFDGWSESVFRADLLELYRSELEGVAAVLPELPIRFSDFSRWERAQGGSADADEDLAYWKQALAGLGEAPSLPNDATGAASDFTHFVTTRFDATEMEAVRQLALQENTTPFVVLLTALELLTRELTDAEDFVITCPVAGRDRPEVHNLVGCFINAVYVRSSFRSASTHLDHLRAVRTRVGEALAHRRLPSSRVVEVLGGWAKRPSLGDVKFQWRDFPRREPAGPATIELEPLNVPSVRSGLALSVTPRHDGADLQVEFDPGKFSPGTVEGWCQRLRRHVRELCSDPLGEIGPLRPVRVPPDPVAALAPPELQSVVGAVDWQTRSHPGAVAVRSPEAVLTYSELWERSGSLATGLLDLGVNPGDHVGVLSNRNAGHIVGMLAVLRAGAVVVP
ncbi:MAG: condensation domain-containing protein, partial [Acidimicrobiales bacterium]